VTDTLEDLETLLRSEVNRCCLAKTGGPIGTVRLRWLHLSRRGGIEGDHLVFRWIEGDTAYSISLHVWKPIAQSFDALKSVVESIIA
jgi:hypothetical protein